jgi:hypothetical protein
VAERDGPLARPLLALFDMQRHWKGLVVLFGLLAAAFVGALWAESVAIALGALVSGLVLAFVMSTAWMRADGHSPEHHPRVDHVFDDTNP